jgi:hypothetical protein
LQRRFGYDPEKAAAYRRVEAEQLRKTRLVEQQRAQAAAAAAAAAADELERRGWIEGLAKGEQPRIRVVNGKFYDFSSAFTWFTEENEFEKTKPAFAPYNDRTRPYYYGLVMQEWLAKSQKHREESPKWRGYLVKGDVLSILPEGLLVDTGTDRTVFLRNHPMQSTLVDGDQVNVLAMPAGRYSYPTAGGTTATVPDYDFGVPPAGLPYQRAITLPALDSK